MDETQNGQSSVDWGAWSAARLGRAIDIAIDRTVPQPVVVVDPSQAYGMDANGNIYMVGQANGAATMPAQKKASPTLVLLLLIGAILIAKG